MPNEQAERYKAQGNTALAGGMTEEAVRLYTLAIREDPFSEVYFSNRSAAYATLARFKEALEDADEVVRLKPAWVKGHTRRGAALSGLKKHEEARKAYLKACEFDPANTQARELMEAEAKAATAAAAQSKEWENDLWSDEEEEAPAPAPSAPGGGAKRSAPGGGGGGASEDNGSRKKRRAPGKLMARLSTSLADASAVTLRVCLQQLCAADEHLAERTLQAGHRATRPTPRAPASPWPSPPRCCTRPVALWPRVSALAAAVLTIRLTMATRAMAVQMLEGLNENSSNGEDSDGVYSDGGEGNEGGGGGGRGTGAAWPKPPALGAGGGGSRKMASGDAEDSD